MIDKVKMNNLILLVFLYFILIICFAFVVRYEYAFVKVDLVYELNYLRLSIGSFIVLICSGLVTFIRSKDFLYSISLLILIFFVLPSAVLFAFIKEIDSRILFSHIFLLACVLLAGSIRIKFNTARIQISQSILLLKIIVIAGIIPFIILYAPYINLKNLLLIDVYETRALMDSAVTNLYTNYTYSWFNKFIIPCLLVFGMYYRSGLTISICTLALIFLYLCGAHKAVFLGLIFMFLLYKLDYLKKANYLLKLIIGISIISLILSLVFKNDFLMTLSVRRAILLPALIDVLYFDFFDNNFLYWSESFNGIFKIYPYELSHSYIIGEKYFGDPDWGANNGIISDGFMNFGILGIILNVIFISIYFSLINQLNISSRFFGLFFLFIVLILSSSLTTVMLTHGGIILLILSFYFMKNTSIEMK